MWWLSAYSNLSSKTESAQFIHCNWDNQLQITFFRSFFIVQGNHVTWQARASHNGGFEVLACQVDRVLGFFDVRELQLSVQLSIDPKDGRRGLHPTTRRDGWMNRICAAIDGGCRRLCWRQQPPHHLVHVNGAISGWRGGVIHAGRQYALTIQPSY